MRRPTLCAPAALLLLLASGCATTKTSNTARTAMEQLLISNAVDQSLDKVNFAPFRGQRVFVDTAMLECVDKNYVTSSIRHRMFHAGASLVDKKEMADIVVEPRSGGVGTDSFNQFVGVPEIAIPGIPLGIPEIQLIKRTTQTASAKIGLIAYTPEDGRNIGQGGTSLAKSTDNNWFVFGVGPWQTGNVKAETKRELPRRSPGAQTLPTQVAFGQGTRGLAAPPTRQSPTPSPFEPDTARVRLTGDEQPETEPPPESVRATGEFLPIPE